jgi:predicted transcriptional regulator
MKFHNGKRYYTIGEAAEMIGRSPQTIKNWYKLAEGKKDFPALPKIFYLDEKKTRYFSDVDVQVLEMFRDDVRYGSLTGDA